MGDGDGAGGAAAELAALRRRVGDQDRALADILVHVGPFAPGVPRDAFDIGDADEPEAKTDSAVDRALTGPYAGAEDVDGAFLPWSDPYDFLSALESTKALPMPVSVPDDVNLLAHADRIELLDGLE